MVFLGGVKTLSGPIAGATALTAFQDILTRFEYWRLSLGLLIILIVIVTPEGIAGLGYKIRTRLSNGANGKDRT